MAFALEWIANASPAYVSFPSWIPTSSDNWSFEVDFETSSDITSDQFVLGNEVETSRVWKLFIRSGQIGILHQSLWAGSGFIQAPVSANTRYKVRGEFDGSDIRLFFDGVQVDSVTGRNLLITDGVTHLSVAGVRAANTTGNKLSAGTKLYSAKFYNDAAQGTLARSYTKETLVGSNDTEYTEQANSQHGTLVNFPTDDSQWIFYDDGGGAVEQPVVSVNAEEVHQANTLSISAFNSVSSVIAEQVESANLIDVFLSQLASSIQAQERHDATALNIEQSAAQSVNSLTAEQIEQANLIGISQSSLVNSVQTQENQQANTLTIEQSAGQSIALNTAQQVEQATVLSLAQQQALAHIVAEQLSAASVTDVSNLQAVTMIIAEESHQANTLNVEQYTGQFVTLIAAEQKNEAQTLLISEVSAIDVLQAEQVTNAETMAFSQVQRLTQITAEQLTEAQLLTILTSGDNTDLSGLRLIPITSKYTINPTSTTRYSLQKV